jgi:hypothetical protein
MVMDNQSISGLGMGFPPFFHIFGWLGKVPAYQGRAGD